jgi:hypothetical protein
MVDQAVAMDHGGGVQSKIDQSMKVRVTAAEEATPEQ